jgi:predicted secreted protein
VTEVRVVAGEVFEFELASNATTGYQWTWVSKPDEKVARITGERYLAPNAQGKVGAGGYQRFTLQAVASGNAVVHLAYVRPFDKPPVPEREKTFSIVVTG